MIFEKVAALLADYKGIDVNTITLDSSFADLELDSLDVADLVMQIEDELGVSIELDQSVTTMKDLIAKKMCIRDSFQGLRDVDKHRQAQLCVRRFDMAHMGHGDADGFRKVLLGEFLCSSVFANPLSEFVIIHHKPPT